MSHVSVPELDRLAPAGNPVAVNVTVPGPLAATDCDPLVPAVAADSELVVMAGLAGADFDTQWCRGAHQRCADGSTTGVGVGVGVGAGVGDGAGDDPAENPIGGWARSQAADKFVA